MLVARLWLLLLFAVSISALSCAANWQCSPQVSLNYNWAQCVDGECRCRSDLGFDGAATAQDRCRCDPPKEEIWKAGTPYCLSLADSTRREAEEKRVQRLVEKARWLYNSTIFPTPLRVLSGEISLDDVFAPTAKGRADPFGTFHIRAVLIEYFYALAIGTTRVVDVHIKELFGSQNKVFARVDFTFEDTFPVHRFWNLTQSARYLFDENDRITSLEIINHNTGKAIPIVPETDAIAIQGMCQILLVEPGNCNQAMDPQGFYTDVQDCVDFMTNISRGTFDLVASNTTVCRQFHTLLTITDPVIHCPHAGKTGGGMCVDTPYDAYYLEDF